MGKKSKSRSGGTANKPSDTDPQESGSPQVVTVVPVPVPTTGKMVNSSKKEPVILEDHQVHPNSDAVSKARTVFVATVCHTCKAVPKEATVMGPEVKLSRCGQCLMISYCSREHQVADWKNHKSLCRVIQQVLKRDHKKYLYEQSNESSRWNQTEWLQRRCGFMQEFGEALERPLQPFEKELLLFPRVCFRCHTRAQLLTCGQCHMFTACPAHLPSSKVEEHEHCPELKLFLAIVAWENSHGFQRPSLDPQITVGLRTKNQGMFQNMQAFFSAVSTKSPPDSLSAQPQDVWLTDVATVPLTVLSALQHAASQAEASRQSLTVHVVGAEMDFEGCCSIKWETYLLHLLPELRLLNVILIGPELSAHPQPYELCSHCKATGCDLRIQHFPGVMYHEYWNEPKEFIKPDFICAFNCGIYRTTGFDEEDSWAPTIPLLGKADILVTTSYTQTEGLQDTIRLLKECPNLKLATPCTRNPFRSLRPQRTLINEESDPLMYKNNYYTIFRGKPPA